MPRRIIVLVVAASCACRFNGAGLDPIDAAPSSEGLHRDFRHHEAFPDTRDPRDVAIVMPGDGIPLLDGEAPFPPAHLNALYWGMGRDDLHIMGTVTVDTTMGTISPAPPSEVKLYGNGSYSILVVRQLTVAQGATLKAQGRLPLIIVARDRIEIAGNIDVAADGTSPGTGGFPGVGPGEKGQGCGGGYAGEYSLGDHDLGGAGGSFAGRGGQGGGGYAAPVACWSSCSASPVNGHCCLTTLAGGSSGGGGGRDDSPIGFGSLGGGGGGGGGALQLSALKELRVTSTGGVNAGGGGGGAGRAPGGSGGGGGSGGAILLEAPVVIVEGIVAANGGGGGGGATLALVDGEAGANGSASLQPAKAGAPGAGATGSGGKGSAAGALDGEAGTAATAVGDGGGGGGGGAGHICVRSGGAKPAGGFSPSSFAWLPLP